MRTRMILEETPPEVLEGVMQDIPLRRLAEPAEVAVVIAFLAGEIEHVRERCELRRQRRRGNGLTSVRDAAAVVEMPRSLSHVRQLSTSARSSSPGAI